MTAEEHSTPAESVWENDVAPNDMDDRDTKERVELYDDTSDDIDWDELIASTDADFMARRFRFISTSQDPVEAEADLRRFLDGILEKVMNGSDTASGADAPR